MHKILFRRDRGVRASLLLKRLLRRAVSCTLHSESIDIPCELNVLLTNDKGIRSVNREMRNVDKLTDVLSFPMFDFIPGAFHASQEHIDPQTGLLPLGDMVMSIDRIRLQAEEYGHSISREATYLAVHSVLHLLGYDHIDEDTDKRLMRSREEEILNLFHI